MRSGSFMNYTVAYPSQPEIDWTNKIAEELFGTEDDETQAKPTLENELKLISVEKNNFICLKNKEGIIAWSVVLPTSKENMEKFLKKEIDEKELFQISFGTQSFETLYLTAVVVLPEYRRMGLGSSLLKKQIEYFKNTYGINDFYAMLLT